MVPPTDNKVSLGCGTLILIALIVMIFSRGSDSGRVSDELQKLRREVRNLANHKDPFPSSGIEEGKKIDHLQKSVDALKRSIDSQSARIESLKSELQQMRSKPDATPPPVTPPVERE